MTNRRQFCPKGHDTFQVGRDSSYRCLECKREDSAAARRAREAEAQAERFAELKRHHAEAERRRKRERARILRAGGVAAQSLLEQETDGCCWATGEVDILADPPILQGKAAIGGRPLASSHDVYCRQHNRELESHREAPRATRL